MWLVLTLAFLGVSGACATALVRCEPDQRDRLLRVLRRAARSRVSACRDRSVARLVGRVVPLGGTVEAPLSGRDCVLWDARVDQGVTQLIRQTQGIDFLLEDETGSALVRVANPMYVVLRHDAAFDSGERPSPLTGRLLAFFARYWRGQPLSPSAMRCTEAALQPGATVSVLGPIALEPVPDRAASVGYRERAMRVVVMATATAPLVISDEKRATKRA